MPPASLKIKTSSDAPFAVDVDTDTDTVSDLKLKIAAKEPSSAADPFAVRLIFAGKVLKDADLLSVYKLQDGQTIHMVRGSKPPPAPGAAAASTSTAAPGASPTAAAAAPTTPSSAQQQQQPMPNPFAALAGLSGMPGATAADGFPGMFGAGFPGMPGGASPNGMPPQAAMMEQMMNNPAMAGMLGQMMSNPQIMDAMVAMNPQLAGMMSPEVRQIMQSEQFRAMMSNPQTLQMIMQMSPMMAAGGGGGLGAFGAMPPPTAAPAGTDPAAAATAGAQPTPGTFPPLPLFNPALMQMMMAANAGAGARFPGMVPGASAAAATTPSRPPEELYQTQLQQLRDMGFFDPAENVRALSLTGGNVEAAIEWLFSHPPGTR